MVLRISRPFTVNSPEKRSFYRGDQGAQARAESERRVFQEILCALWRAPQWKVFSEEVQRD
jgi:hypothetical protein